MTEITPMGLNQAVAEAVEALDAIDDLTGLIEGWSIFVLSVASARFDDPREEAAAMQVGRVYSSLAVVAHALRLQRSTTQTHPLPADIEGEPNDHT